MSNSKTFTSFGGCDIVVVSKAEKKVFMELLAITWKEENWVRGKFTIDETNHKPENPTGHYQIWISFTNEYGKITRIELDEVTVSYNPSNRDVWDFEAYKINEIKKDHNYDTFWE